MKKVYVIVLLFLLYLTTCTKIEVDFDTERDMIIKGGKVYLPIDENYKPHEGAKKSQHEEELATGATFWFYIFAVLCKINII